MEKFLPPLYNDAIAAMLASIAQAADLSAMGMQGKFINNEETNARASFMPSSS